MSRADRVEINFDGIVGPSHNYAGLSLGNLAASRNAGRIAHPRRAALQGIAKMRANLALGLVQGILLPHTRPAAGWLAALGTDVATADLVLLANAMSSSPMWAANAATVSPAADTADGRCHLTVANLLTMPHRSLEAAGTMAQLAIAFANDAFSLHPPIPAPFGDEGAANHMRLCTAPDDPGIEIFVYGTGGGPFPARQHEQASRAIARCHGLDPARTMFVRQSDAAIAAGAFHNDVVAVADGRILFAHEQAFADCSEVMADLATRFRELQLVEVPAARIPLDDAIRSYLFNAQLVTPPDGVATLVVPSDVADVPSVHRWLEEMIAGDGPIRRLRMVDVRESMANGGGPACLRLRVVADPATIDPRFLVDDAKLDRVAAVIVETWPEAITPADLSDPSVQHRIAGARSALLDVLDLTVLV